MVRLFFYDQKYALGSGSFYPVSTMQSFSYTVITIKAFLELCSWMAFSGLLFLVGEYGTICICSLITVVSGNDQGDGSAVAVLESMGSKGSVLVNGTHVKKNTSCVLNSGDEVVFGVLGNHSYVSFSFVQLNVLFSFSNEKYQL